MRNFFVTGPRWAQGVVMGAFFGPLFGLATKLVVPTSWTQALVGALTTGPAFGITMAWLFAQQTSSLREAGDLPKEKHAAALKASTSGPIPNDPDVRRAALAIARNQLPTLPRLRALSIGLMVVMLAALVLNIVGTPDWKIAIYLLSIPLLALNIIAPSRQRRRISRLEQATPPATNASPD